jgi:acetylornithine deacetylase
MPLDVVDTLCDLVRIPSVNPMGRDLSGDEFFEHALTDHLEQLFGRLELPFFRQEVAPKQANIMARLEGNPVADEEAELIVFEAHQDTVPADGMVIPPWTPDVRHGRVYGRGSCDTKGGMACMLAALSRLAAERPSGMPTVVMACSVNEEHGYSGALHMAKLWSSGDSPLIPRVPDAVIVAEPTELNVVVAHKGVMRWRCHTKGRAAHSAAPQHGENAIYHMARVLGALEQYAREIAPGLGCHPLVGSPTLSVGVISGGISVNTVPDRCTIEIDRRVLPGEDCGEARQAVIDFLREQLGTLSIVHDEPFLASGGLSDKRNSELARQLRRVIQEHGGPGAMVGVPYGTDARAFDQVGAPSVVFGPGAIDQAHTCDEWIAIDQLHTATEIFYQFGKRGLHSAD